MAITAEIYPMLYQPYYQPYFAVACKPADF